MNINIIPQPKKINFLSGSKFNIRKNTLLKADGIFKSESILLLEKAGFNISDSKKASQEISVKKNTKFKHKEEYRLSVRSASIEVQAKETSGVFYALQTLEKLTDKGKTPCVDIHDFPDHSVRCIHWDLKRFSPSFEYIVESIRRFGKLKINTILMEYEDKFPYGNFKELNHPDAFSKRQLEELHEVAGENHITLIPLVQTFGHLESFLTLPEYADIREIHDDATMLCPLNPKSLDFIRKIITEIAENHPDSPYIHIGADEAWNLAKCPKCKKFAEKHGHSELIVKYLNLLADIVTGLGKIPLIWHDMLINYPEAIEKLDKRIIVVYWEYQDNAEYVPGPKWQGLYFVNDIEKIPEKIQNTFKKYWAREYKKGRTRSFAYLEFFKDHGLTVWGASATRRMETGVVNFNESFDNILYFSGRAKQNNAPGMINTSWAASGTPFELAWYGFFWAAACYWNTKTDRELFNKAYVREFFGIEDVEPVQIYWLLSGQSIPNSFDKMEKAERLANKWITRVKKNEFHLDMINLAIGKLKLKYRIIVLLFFMIEYQNVQRNCPERKIKLIRERIKSIIDDNENTRKSAMELYKSILPQRVYREEIVYQFSYITKYLGILSENIERVITTSEEIPGLYNGKNTCIEK